MHNELFAKSQVTQFHPSVVSGGINFSVSRWLLSTRGFDYDVTDFVWFGGWCAFFFSPHRWAAKFKPNRKANEGPPNAVLESQERVSFFSHHLVVTHSSFPTGPVAMLYHTSSFVRVNYESTLLIVFLDFRPLLCNGQLPRDISLELAD